MRKTDPAQGWKLHVSATPLTANEVFARLRPVLLRHDVIFKVPSRLEMLAQLNSGVPAFSQIGKFLTAYPASEKAAIDLARELHTATHDLRGPKIPFDVPYRKNSLVYYRYGSFRQITPQANTHGVIFDPAGKAHLDRRGPARAIPHWLSDPFKNCSAQSDLLDSLGLLGCDYLPFRTIVQRGKGGVYEAVDISVRPARRVIVKEGRRNGETAWNGEDGYARIQKEGRVLRALHAEGLPVPRVLREFTHEANRYLILEKIGGRPLLRRNQVHPKKPSWRRACKIVNQVGELLDQVHRAGWVWRDCKPANILVDRGRIHFIDFEGACRLNKVNILPWSSLNYSLPLSARTTWHLNGAQEDDYALGVIGFQFATGQFPSRHSRRRSASYKNTGCPDFLRAKIEALLRFE